MQYDQGMSSIKRPCSSPSDTSMLQLYSTNHDEALKQTSFTARFALPMAESGNKPFHTPLPSETLVSNKRVLPESISRDSAATTMKTTDLFSPVKRARLQEFEREPFVPPISAHSCAIRAFCINQSRKSHLGQRWLADKEAP